VPNYGIDPNGILIGDTVRYNYFPFVYPVRFIGQIFIGFELYYNLPQDTFALSVFPRSPNMDSSFIYYKMPNLNDSIHTDSVYSWYKTSAISESGLKLDIIPWFCSSVPGTVLPSPYTPVKQHYLINTAIYPNPTRGNITVMDGDICVPIQLEIYDISGKPIISEQIIPGQIINIGDLSSGIYIFRITDTEKVQYAKVILVK
jgi:hypothetical protein